MKTSRDGAEGGEAFLEAIFEEITQPKQTQPAAPLANLELQGYLQALKSTPAAGTEPVYSIEKQREIQGNIMPGFKKNYQSFLFFRILEVAEAKKFLHWILPEITSMKDVLAFKKLHKRAQMETGKHEPAGKKGLRATWTGISFSYTGIALLAGTEEAGKFGDEAFRAGQAKRSAFLGDPTEPSAVGHPRHWKFGGTDPQHEVHLMLVVAADRRRDRDEWEQKIRSHAARKGLHWVYTEQAEALPGKLEGHEHFGFKDGISDPAVRGMVEQENAGDPEYIYPRYIDADKEGSEKKGRAEEKDRSLYFAKPGQQLVWPGQFLVGEPRQNPYKLTEKCGKDPDPNFPDWARLGSYAVCRRLQQDVGGFWQFVDKVAAKLGLDRRRFAAQLVGRWPSGAPLMRHPQEDATPGAMDDLDTNHFLFDDRTRPIHVIDPEKPEDGSQRIEGTPAHDFLGLVCPHFAHIRKMHPRDSPTDLGPVSDTAVRMILRRGIPYGSSVFDEDSGRSGSPEASRGLLFLCYNASIVNQFEFLTQKWANSPLHPNVGGHDPILGQVQDSGERARYLDMPLKDEKRPLGYRFERVTIDRDFVIPTGGEYFFTPPISALSKTGRLGKA